MCDIYTQIHTHTHMYMCLVTQSCPTLCDPMDCSLPGSSVNGDSPSTNTAVGCPGDLPNPGTEPRSPTLQADSLPSEPPGKPQIYIYVHVSIHTHKHTHTYMTENNSSIKKNETVLFVTKWMDLEGITLNEITQVKKNTV